MQPVIVGSTTVDYSQPLASYAAPESATPAADAAPAADAPPPPSEQAADLFDQARDAFKQGDYDQALQLVNQAIGQLPDDATLHEFRALVLFAQGNFKEAAGTIYAVLSAGPGWDWTTLVGMYPDVETYTKQLRALEAYRRQNPDAADARFLLAYHYITMGKTDAAANELKEVVRINPKDALAQQLLTSLLPESEQPKPPPEPTQPATPVTAAQLAGAWKASPGDGTTINLNLGKDSKYTWNVAQGQKTHEFGGGFTVADNLLILNQEGNPAMVGQVTQVTANSFNFRLPGSPPSDPGLTFTR